MTTNVLRDEISSCISNFRAAVRSHDRGVLLGVILSAIPVLPMPVFGLALGLLNRNFCRAGKLDESETALVNRGLIVAIVNIAVAVALLAFAIHIFSSIPFSSLLDNVRERIASALSIFYHLVRPMRSGIAV